MRQYRALLRGQGTFFVAQSWADCIINMSGFDLRQAQDIQIANRLCVAKTSSGNDFGFSQ